MILTLLAALSLQTPEPSDAATAVLALSDQCLVVMTDEDEAPAGIRRLRLADGREADVIIGRDGCSLGIDDWTDDAGALAARVRDGLLAESDAWTVSQWRERRVNESGPTLWTSIVLPDVRRHSAYWVQIIEPERGAPRRLEVSYGIGP